MLARTDRDRDYCIPTHARFPRAHLESLRSRFYLARDFAASAGRAEKWLDRFPANRMSIFLLPAPSRHFPATSGQKKPTADTRANSARAVADLAERRESLAVS